MSKPVATAAEVKAGASTDTTDNASNVGAWAAGPAPLQVTTDGRIKIGGKPVALAADQTFTFSGANSSGSPIPPYPSPVSLKAKPTKLRAGGKYVLLDGDKEDDAPAALTPTANKITVSSGLKLKTA